jgi:WD40 repeat protein
MLLSVVFSPDGQTLASIAQDYTVLLWSTCEFDCICNLRPATDNRRAEK